MPKVVAEYSINVRQIERWILLDDFFSGCAVSKCGDQRIQRDTGTTDANHSVGVTGERDRCVCNNQGHVYSSSNVPIGVMVTRTPNDYALLTHMKGTPLASSGDTPYRCGIGRNVDAPPAGC